MKMYTASQFSPEKKLKVIKSYLEKSSSLRKHAHSLGISYMTLWRWVKKYRQKGKEALRKSHKKSGKRFSKNLEKKIDTLHLASSKQAREPVRVPSSKARNGASTISTGRPNLVKRR